MEMLGWFKVKRIGQFIRTQAIKVNDLTVPFSHRCPKPGVEGAKEEPGT
jgi:hypothetical protein